MPHVVTDSCIRCKYTDCVEVCPVDCFRAGKEFLVIDPDECIDCCVCVVECPVRAIYEASDLPSHLQHFLEVNAKLSKAWPAIVKKQEPLPGAEKWKFRTDKLKTLEPDIVDPASKHWA